MASTTTIEAAPALDLSKWSAVPRWLIGIGGVVVIFGLISDAQQVGYSWLVAFMFYLSLCLGGLFLVILHHLFDSSWSVPIRRVCEHLACLLPVMFLLFLPVMFLAKHIYPWMSMDPHVDHALHAKSALINRPMFYIVAVILFAVWTVLAWRLRYWSLEQDRTGAVKCTRNLRMHAAWGVFAFAFTLTLAAIFWMKSLQHHWFSTMYGVYYFAGSVWAALAGIYMLGLVLKRAGPLDGVMKHRQFHDLGVLLFAFTVFYAYIHFSQYFLIWNAAVPEETFWYVLREEGTWWDVGMLIVFGHFVVPFLMLLRIDFKVTYFIMIPICVWALLMHFLDMSYNIMPVLQIFRKAQASGDIAEGMRTMRPDGFELHWMDLACLAFIGGVLALVFIRYFKAHAPFPQKDPRMAEALGVHLPMGGAMEDRLGEEGAK